MDPNATLKMVRDAKRSNDIEGELEAYRNLDGWLSRGGFLPDDWQVLP